MQVIRKDPGKPPRLVEIPNTLKALQQAVGGYIETQVIRKDPGKPPRLVEIPNTLKALQQAVGGYIETVSFCEDALVICNEEGLLKQAVGGYIETVSFCEDALVICNEEGLLMGLAPNCSFLGIPFVGTILIAGRSGEEFCSLSHTAQQLLLSQLGAGKQL